MDLVNQMERGEIMNFVISTQIKRNYLQEKSREVFLGPRL